MLKEGHKIEKIEVIPLSCELAESFGFSQGWYKKRETTLVKITTNSGIIGWGECFGPIAGNRELIEDFFAPLLKSENPLNTEKLWELMYRKSRAAFQSFIPMTAISGIDIALWDTKGKVLGVPIYKLLGGASCDRVKAYATGHYFKKTESIKKLFSHIITEAKRNIEAGFDTLKLKIGLKALDFNYEEDIELVHRVREAVGEKITLMADANYAYDLHTAILVGKELEKAKVLWFEEPIDPTDLEGHKRLKTELIIPIAAGECLAGRHGFKDFISQRAIDIVQPDTCASGGITECRKIADMASAYNIKFTPHVWGSPIAIAASLQLIASLPVKTLLEFDRSENPIREEMGKSSIIREGSYIKVPQDPGLGINIDKKIIEKYRIDQ